MNDLRTSLVAQWLRIHLPVQGTRVRSLVREDPMCCRATKPARHNCWAHTPQLLKPMRSRACVPQLLESTCHKYWAHTLQLLKPVHPNKRSHLKENPTHHNEEWPPLTAMREKPARSNEDPTQPKKFKKEWPEHMSHFKIIVLCFWFRPYDLF